MQLWQRLFTLGLLSLSMACNSSNRSGVTPPIAPTNFVATVVSSTAIRLTWTASPAANGYVLERKTGNSSYAEVATPTSSPYDDNGLAPSTPYSYRLKAKNSGGASSEVEASALTPGTGGSGTSKIGLVNLSESGGVGLASASFFGIAQTQPQPPSSLYPGIGTCTVSKTSTIPIPPSLPSPIAGLNPISLDAGPQLTVKTDPDTYALLQRQIEGSSISYLATNLGPLPATARVEITGAAGGFPALNAAMPSLPAEFDLSATPSLTEVNKDSLFSWTDPLGGSAQMVLIGYQSVSDTEFIGFTCIAPDTGSFSFPAQTKAELDAAAFSKGQLFLAIRQNSRTQTQGDTHLVLSASLAKLIFSGQNQR